MSTVNQSSVQASIRAITGTALPYSGDWHALFDHDSIAAGTFNERLLLWLNAKLVLNSLPATATLNGAMQAYAAFKSAYNWNSMTTI
jgi:hypothetical protein